MVFVTRYIEPDHRGKAFGMIGSTVALGEGIGPVLGGLISEYVHWPYLFVLPMMTLVTLLAFLKTLPTEPSRKGKFDVYGVLILVPGIVTFTFC